VAFFIKTLVVEVFDDNNNNAMSGGSFATTAWRVLRLRSEETTSDYRGQL
jgi:hypothetical protein